MSTDSPELTQLKGKLKSTWMAGDFGLIAKSYEDGAADFVNRLNLEPGTMILDVACGTGNLSLPAAKAGATVTGVDIASNLIEQARLRAKSEGIRATFDEGDAEQLPYGDSTFDIVLTMFGAMFAPRPELAASELFRVCRSGGRIAMANWTPSGFAGQMFKIVAQYVPPPSMPSPIKWGEEETVRQRLGNHVNIAFTKRLIVFTYPFSPTEVVQYFRQYFGPASKAFDFLETDPENQANLRRDLVKLWTDHNQRSDGTTLVESEYLEVLATKH